MLLLYGYQNKQVSAIISCFLLLVIINILSINKSYAAKQQQQQQALDSNVNDVVDDTTSKGEEAGKSKRLGFDFHLQTGIDLPKFELPKLPKFPQIIGKGHKAPLASSLLPNLMKHHDNWGKNSRWAKVIHNRGPQAIDIFKPNINHNVNNELQPIAQHHHQQQIANNIKPRHLSVGIKPTDQQNPISIVDTNNHNSPGRDGYTTTTSPHANDNSSTVTLTSPEAATNTLNTVRERINPPYSIQPGKVSRYAPQDCLNLTTNRRPSKSLARYCARHKTLQLDTPVTTGLSNAELVRRLANNNSLIRSEKKPDLMVNKTKAAAATDANNSSSRVVTVDTCGIRKIPLNEESINNQSMHDSDNGVWPWQVIIRAKSKLCGAVLISDRLILASVHCFDAHNITIRGPSAVRGPEDLDVTVGVSQLKDKQPDNNIYNIDRVCYSAWKSNVATFSSYYDYVLFRTVEKIKLSDVVQPICLPNAERNLALKNNTTDKICFATGWGEIDASNNIFPDKLQQLRLYETQCANEYIKGADGEGSKQQRCYKEARSSNLPPLATNNLCHLGRFGGPISCYDKQFNSWYLEGMTSLPANNYNCATSATTTPNNREPSVKQPPGLITNSFTNRFVENVFDCIDRATNQ